MNIKTAHESTPSKRKTSMVASSPMSDPRHRVVSDEPSAPDIVMDELRSLNAYAEKLGDRYSYKLSPILLPDNRIESLAPGSREHSCPIPPLFDCMLGQIQTTHQLLGRLASLLELIDLGVPEQ